MGALGRPAIRLAAVAAAMVVVLSACDPVMGNQAGPVRHAVLTSDSGMTYRYAGNRGGVFVQPGQPDWDDNVRELFWYPDAKFLLDQQVCTTMNTVATGGSAGLLQPGVALRIAPVTANGQGVRAVTITQNTFWGAIWLFNVHVWNTLDTVHPFTQIAQFDVSGVVGSLPRDGYPNVSMVPAPWHICARTSGKSLSFFVWTGPHTQPTTTDASRVFSVALPDGWTYPGYAGVYIGHLHHDQGAAFSDVSTSPVS